MLFTDEEVNYAKWIYTKAEQPRPWDELTDLQKHNLILFASGVKFMIEERRIKPS